MLTAAYVVAALAGHSVALVLVAIVVLDVAAQALNILNQLRMFSVSAEARSRLNTAFVTGNFIGGAIGSSAATLLWSAGGWSAVSVAGIGLGVASFLIWLAGPHETKERSGS